MASGQIVLFDIPSKTRTAWSLNPWKTRMLLNYKGLDYRTEWLEYPDIRPRLEPHLPPNDGPGDTPYTIPAIQLPSGRYVMDSAKIARALEEAYPSAPSAHLDSPYHARVLEQVRAMMRLLPPVYIVNVVERILGEPSRPYWYRTRAEHVGMPLDRFAAEHPQAEAWDAAAPMIARVTEMLKEETGGPFFMGAQVSYADFIWGGLLVFFRCQGEEVLGELLARSGDAKVHMDLLEALSPWTKRNDH